MNIDNSVCITPSNLFERAGSPQRGLVLACLWSNPSLSAAGHTPDAVATVAKLTGMDEASVKEAIASLAEQNEVLVDWQTREAMARTWLEFNYLQDRSMAERPERVMAAIDGIASVSLRQRLLQEAARLDIHFDSTFGNR